jgi:hypothetical protein
MVLGQDEQRRALIAFALHQDGKLALEQLSSFGEVASPAYCYYLSPSGWGGASKPTCERWDDSRWTQPPWARVTTGVADVLDAAIRDVFDLYHSSSAKPPPDVVDLLFLTHGWQHDPKVFPTDIFPAVQGVRQRHQRIRRTLLAVQHKFEVASRVVNGTLKWPPTALGPGSCDLLKAFEYVVLIDEITPDGLTIAVQDLPPDIGVSLAILTLSPLATSLDRGIRDEVAQLGDSGRYVGVGTAHLGCPPEHVRDTIADYLYRQMAEVVSKQTQAKVAQQRRTAAQAEFSHQLDEGLNRTGAATQTTNSPDSVWLRRKFEEAGYEMGVLILCHHACRAVLELRTNQLRAVLWNFTINPFAPWYARKRARLEKPSDPVLPAPKVYPWNAVLIRVGSVVAATAGAVLYLGLVEGPVAVIICLIGVASAVVGLILPRPVIRLQDELPEPVNHHPGHEQRRGRWIWVHDLAQRATRAGQALHRNLEQIKKEVGTPPVPPLGLQPLPDELCAALLASAKIDPRETLAAFWRTRQDPLVVLFADGVDGLPQALRSYAQEQCARFESLSWNNIIDLMGGEAAFDTSLMQSLLDQLLKLSQPRMPVLGERSLTLVTLPLGTRQQVLDVVRSRFPGRTTVETAPIDGITVVQWTQGYRMTDPGRASEAGGL